MDDLKKRVEKLEKEVEFLKSILNFKIKNQECEKVVQLLLKSAGFKK